MNRKELLAALRNEPLAMAVDMLPALCAAFDGRPEQMAEQMAAVAPATERAVARKEGAVAVIPVSGVLAGRGSILNTMLERYGLVTVTETLLTNLRAAVDDAGVKAVVLDFNSPGGTTYGMAEAADAIMAMRGTKPIIAQANHWMASAAYWLAASADQIVASKSAMVGSIGVYTMHTDWSKANEIMGVKPTYVFAGKYKVDGNPDEPLSDTARATLQASVDDSYKLFTAGVAKGRGIAASAVVNGYGEGRCLPASAALAEGMVDKVRSIAETLAAYGVVAQPTNGGGTDGRSIARRRAEIEILNLS